MEATIIEPIKTNASSRRMSEKTHTADTTAMTTPKERLHTVDEFVEKLGKTIRNRSIQSQQ